MSGSNGKNGNGKAHGNGKPGPKLKITPEAQEQVLGAVGVGASLADAAALIGVGYKTLYRMRRTNPDFDKGVKRAVRDGKLKLIQKVANASSWQAAAWMLERRWGEEFGRHDHVKVKHSGTIDTEHSIAANTISDPEAVRLAEALNERMARHPSGNGQSNN